VTETITLGTIAVSRGADNRAYVFVDLSGGKPIKKGGPR
jgi:hypothetical protein